MYHVVYFFAAHEETKFRLGLAGGCKNLCCTGAGIVLVFNGPCTVYTQSRDPEKWNPYKNLAKQQKKQKKHGHGGP